MLLTLFGGSPPVPTTSHSSWGMSWGGSWGWSWGSVKQPDIVSASSGYRRLVIYKLQEDWLAKRKAAVEPKPAANEPVITVSLAERAPPVKLVAQASKQKSKQATQSKPVVVIAGATRPIPLISYAIEALPEVPWESIYEFTRKMDFTFSGKHDILKTPVEAEDYSTALLLLLSA